MRLIDADALVADTQFFDGHEWHYGYTEDEIKEAPTIDAVEVVRCGECKYWDQLEPDHPYGYCMAAKHGCVTQNWDIGIYRKQRYDFFCADGEREEATDAST